MFGDFEIEDLPDGTRIAVPKYSKCDQASGAVLEPLLRAPSRLSFVARLRPLLD